MPDTGTCECGKENQPVRPDPYLEEIYDRIELTALCDDCWRASRDEILWPRQPVSLPTRAWKTRNARNWPHACKYSSMTRNRKIGASNG